MGMIIFSFVHELPWASPYRSQSLTMHMTEIMVIVAIMATGLSIDEVFKFKFWSIPLRLISITMLLTIGAMMALGYWWLGWGLSSALLLGAVLAPTDPVLASDVQVGPPNSDDSHRVKFALTAEAGMNDGFAFPFVWLAITLAVSTQNAGDIAINWFAYDVLYRITMGAIIGFSVGKLIIFFFFVLPDKFNSIHVRQGLVALSATLFVYGLTELAHGYGFIAVFVTALTIRNYEMTDEYHTTLHKFIEQIEHILLAVLLILFGGSLVDGILNYLTWPMALCGLALLFIIRPLASYIGLMGHEMPQKEKLAIGFFGIRGIGSFFYLAFALNETDFAHDEKLWSLVAFVVLLSIIVHGISATHVMKTLQHNK
jgi:NhaP-type Na+/H+ or K+/H+ antiporter